MFIRGEEIPVFIGQSGPLNGQRWTIAKTIVIGRDISCDIIIPDRQISRFHANLMPAANGTILEDLGSKNGTYCNGQKVEKSVMLQDGDLVQMALVQHFVYLSSESTLPLDASKLPVGQKRSGKLHFDNRSRRVWIGQNEVLPPLSASQFKLLQLLFEQEGAVVSRDELIAEIWGVDEAVGVSDQAFDALVRRLRQRLGTIDAEHNYITTMRGYGVKFENKPE
jgi:pSer/pThr/pTyr-binding forkhead associated (FHA) protein